MEIFILHMCFSFIFDKYNFLVKLKFEKKTFFQIIDILILILFNLYTVKMNELFRKFKKKYGSSNKTNNAQQNQPATLADLLKEVSEKDDKELNDTYGHFDRNNRSYLSISKSGRIKSRNSYQSRSLKDDIFTSPSDSNLTTTTTRQTLSSNNNNNAKPSKMNMFNKYYSQHSTSANSTGDSGTSSDSFQSSLEDINY